MKHKISDYVNVGHNDGVTFFVIVSFNIFHPTVIRNSFQAENNYPNCCII